MGIIICVCALCKACPTNSNPQRIAALLSHPPPLPLEREDREAAGSEESAWEKDGFGLKHEH